MRIDYLGLEAFVAIAELGSFGRAAAQLNLSQTALSHRIRKIEEDLGLQLLVRTTREVSLTKVGQALLPQAREHLNHLEELYANLRKRGREKQLLLNFACLPTIATSYLPLVLRQFSGEYPDLTIQLHDRPVPRIAELVQAGDAEFGITILGAGHWDLESDEICEEDYILLVPRTHRLADRGTICRADLEGEAFVRIRTQSANRELVYDALGPYRDRLIWRYEVQNAATAMSLVSAGLAVTVLPSVTARMASDNIVGLRFSDVKMSRPLGVLRRRGTQLSEAGQRLIDLLRQQIVQTRPAA